tara:strand:- start:711 stop:1043 length:333 start_codon:yes stop_codon:yes gene_type:complete
MKIQTELNNMEKSDLKWICKSLHIKCTISDSKQTIIRKLLNPMNKKYNSGSMGQLLNYEGQQKQYDDKSKEDSHKSKEYNKPTEYDEREFLKRFNELKIKKMKPLEIEKK